jgi:copper homeostasis protein
MNHDAPSSPKPILEVCIDDAAGLDAALEGGADRIELCSALALGGLTPSKGFMTAAAGAGIPVSAMVRPRPGSFVFSSREIDMMKRDIDAAREAGLSGVVLGASLESGVLDVKMLETLCRHAEGLDRTLHRAFDLVPVPQEALEAAIALGFSRILTSGGQRTALQGLDLLEELLLQAEGRISIMPGSGVNPTSAPVILERLNVFELHASCAASIPCSDPRLVMFQFSGQEVRRTDAQIVATLKALLLESVAARSTK